jgi:hypothetical protein
MIFEKLKD